MDGNEAEATLMHMYAQAWGDARNPELDGLNPHYRNRYATLAATMGEVRKACKARGIAYVQLLSGTREEGLTLRSAVTGAGGSWMELSSMPVAWADDPQRLGSALTYAKRQLAQCDWGIVGDDDDDAEAASAPQPAPAQRQERGISEKRGKYIERISQLFSECVALGVKPDALAEWCRATLGTDQQREMSDEQMVAYGQHLAAVAKGARELAEARAAKEKGDEDAQ